MFKYSKMALLIAIQFTLSSTIAFAEQKFTTKPNGKIAFIVSTENVTRLRLVNDRVVEIVTDESAFEQKNDEVSGDIYFRKLEGVEASVERGYLITEKGVTLSYQMSPVKRPASDVVVTIKGVLKGPETTGSNSVGTSKSRNAPSLAYGDGYKNNLIALVRSVIVDDLDRRKKGAKGSKFSIRKSGYQIDAYVVVGGQNGSQINEPKFAKPNVLAVWSEYATLAPNQKGWLVVVRR